MCVYCIYQIVSNVCREYIVQICKYQRRKHGEERRGEEKIVEEWREGTFHEEKIIVTKHTNTPINNSSHQPASQSVSEAGTVHN